MSTTIRVLTLASLTVLLAHGAADAATATFTQLPVDAMAVTFFRSLSQVWVPIISMIALIGLVVNMFFGFLHIGPKLVGFIFGVALLALGLPGLSKLFGTGLTPAAELTPAERMPVPGIMLPYGE